MLIINVRTQAKATLERLVVQRFNLSMVNLSQKIDARIASMKLMPIRRPMIAISTSG
jgi:hypothetical protein